MIILLCGLSGVGKTTLATNVQARLNKSGMITEIIDGDEYRKTICRDLGFSKADRFENIRRLGAVANEFSTKGIISIISAINPYEVIRLELKARYKHVKLIHVDCSLNILLERDTKGLYQKALLPAGDPQKIENLTGINDEFEIPVNPDLYIHTGRKNTIQCVDELYHFILHAFSQLQSSLQIHQPLKMPA